MGDEDVTGWPSENLARVGVGYISQVDAVFAPLTVRENLEMGGYLLRPGELPVRIAPRARGLPPPAHDADPARAS